jgi:hypothetical protein
LFCGEYTVVVQLQHLGQASEAHRAHLLEGFVSGGHHDGAQMVNALNGLGQGEGGFSGCHGLS